MNPHYPERKATRGHIRHAIAYALAEKRVIGGNAANNDPSKVSDMTRSWYEKATTRSVRQLARYHLDYWRYRAHMRGVSGPGSGDRRAARKWAACT